MALLQFNNNGDFIQKNPTIVAIRLMFQRIGEIDTMNEKYQAQASIEARWLVPIDEISPIISSLDRLNFENGKSVSLNKYADTHWHPQLFVENALGDLKEQIRYTARKTTNTQACVCEHRDVKGVFWEKLELHHFPADVQELTISVGSTLYDDRVVLMPDPYFNSGVNREAFVDQQEWSLYEHVDATQRFVREFFHSMSDEETSDATSSEGRKRSFVSVSCHAARSSAYFYWNGYCLIFLITICGFCIFSMPPNLPQNRLQTGATLLLTSITFRWTVNRSLPTISYLTSLDKYAIISISILILLCVWHAIIGFIIYVDNRMITNATDRYSWTDHAVFLFMFGLYAFMHVVMFLWLYSVPLARRREWDQKDVAYREKLRNHSKEAQSLQRLHSLDVLQTKNGDKKYEMQQSTAHGTKNHDAVNSWNRIEYILIT